MTSSRREFIRKVGMTGLAAAGLSKIIKASPFSVAEEPQREHKGLTILFQGDSITDGNRTRDNDWNHIMGHGYASLIASRLWYDYPEKDLMFYNRGISGNRVRDLDARWQQDAIDLRPDVISILIGVNDIIATVMNWDPEPVARLEEHYRNILDKTRQALPECQLILCEPFILPLGRVKENPDLWQTEIRKLQALTASLAGKYDAVFVSLQEPFNRASCKTADNYWIWDGIHPMPAGHELIARCWIREVRKKLTFIKQRSVG